MTPEDNLRVSVDALLQWWRKRHGVHSRTTVRSWHEFADPENGVLDDILSREFRSVWIHVPSGDGMVWSAVADMCQRAGLHLADSPAEVQTLLIVTTDQTTSVPDWCEAHSPPLLILWDAFGLMFVHDTIRIHFRDLSFSLGARASGGEMDTVPDSCRPMLLSSYKTLVERPITSQPFHQLASYGQIDNVGRFFDVLANTPRVQHLRSFPNLTRVDLYIDTSTLLAMPPAVSDWRKLVKLLDGWIDRQPKLSLFICHCIQPAASSSSSSAPTNHKAPASTRQHYDLLKRLRHYAGRKLPRSHEWYLRPARELFTTQLSSLIFECVRADFWSDPCPGQNLYSDFLQAIEIIWSTVKHANTHVTDPVLELDNACGTVILSHPLFTETLDRLWTLIS